MCQLSRGGDERKVASTNIPAVSRQDVEEAPMLPREEEDKFSWVNGPERLETNFFTNL
jgi:hypothetical protein